MQYMYTSYVECTECTYLVDEKKKDRAEIHRRRWSRESTNCRT